jgi:hypothetical protein
MMVESICYNVMYKLYTHIKYPMVEDDDIDLNLGLKQQLISFFMDMYDGGG